MSDNPYSLSNQKEFFHNIITDALNYLDGYRFQMTEEQKQKAHDVLVVKAPNRRSNCSRAGFDSIIICTTYWQIENVISGKSRGVKDRFKKLGYHKPGHYYWNEYCHFDADPKCGGMHVKKGDIDHGNLIQVLHELSHFVQHNLYYSDPGYWGKHMRKAHGGGFKEIYSMLREKFCNDPAVRKVCIALWRAGFKGELNWDQRMAAQKIAKEVA
jgi:hypothetical protein|tara:strand:+ start:1222 stop:1860 length:639 start_codon:yes stop_codon:yes gene_type:complete